MEELINGVMIEVSVTTTSATFLVVRLFLEECFMDSANSAMAIENNIKEK